MSKAFIRRGHRFCGSSSSYSLTSVHCCKTKVARLRVNLSIFDAANVYFARELRSCVKVEVAVLGSWRP